MEMTGWKTWTAAIGSIASGIGLIIAGLISDPIDGTKIGEGWTLILAGLALVGIGHKIEKSGKGE